MPLTAKIKSTGETVCILDYENPRDNLNKNDLCCKLCNSDMSIKDGLVISKHFFHLSQCTTDFERKPESIEHHQGKKYVRDYLVRSGNFDNAKIEFELPIHKIKRVIDVAAIFPGGWIVANEIQLSSITTEELRDRSEDYRSQGIEVTWWLGKSAYTETNKNWVREYNGEVMLLEWSFDNFGRDSSPIFKR